MKIAERVNVPSPKIYIYNFLHEFLTSARDVNRRFRPTKFTRSSVRPLFSVFSLKGKKTVVKNKNKNLKQINVKK